ncbi:xre family transcriptional regulator : : HTH_3 [Gemmata massiliana]|uniref:Xre family transcriptional regulator:: HTH_3 n=1 Tax=Gemmata massiliana TaxID=1210884 RepID=A0A6P2D794_9BACT|nr:helix-turn-helix transcriptional regulator [Gemmata massiliana]VTR97019.1 xre family transcriptional regulator : : HTH_3 [Gemmata massiliana]
MSNKQTNTLAEEGGDLIAILKDAVTQSGLSLNTIAKESGLSQSQLSRFVSGERTISLESAAKLFEYFGLRVVKPKQKELPLAEPEVKPPLKKSKKK